jgi:non-specific protein-tyrosine kinase
MEIRQYLSIIWRRWWLIVLGAAAAGLTALLIGVSSTPVYRASARLLLDEPPGGSSSEYNQLLLEQRLAQTYAEIIEMPSVLEGTIVELDLPLSVADLQQMVGVSALRDTKIIDISVEDIDPERAAAIANQIGYVFIEQNREREALRYAEPVANWDVRIEDLSAEISQVQAELGELEEATAATDRATRLLLEAQMTELQSRRGDAVDNLNTLLAEQARQSSNVVLLEEALANRAPIRPRILRNTVLAVLIGAIMGLGIALLVEYLDDTVKDADQIRAAVDLPALGSVSTIQGMRGPNKLVAHEQPRDPNSEAYRAIRTNLSFAAIDDDLRSIVVTSPSPTDGKSTTVANLGVIFAQAGKDTIIVDADLRRPVQHIFFGLSNARGLSTAYLDHQLNPARYAQTTHVSGLRLLASGLLPPNPAELLSSERMDEIYKALLEEADVILIDSPPVLSVTDAAVTAQKASGCLFVVKARQTKEMALIEAVDQLDATGANILGVVINMARRGRKYNYYYQDQSEYEDRVEGEKEADPHKHLLPSSSE